MFLQYLDQRHRADLTAILDAAGSRATPDRPLVWISFEWTPDRSEVELRLTTWPNGETRVLAKCHPYGDAVEWLDGDTGSLAP